MMGAIDALSVEKRIQERLRAARGEYAKLPEISKKPPLFSEEAEMCRARWLDGYMLGLSIAISVVQDHDAMREKESEDA